MRAVKRVVIAGVAAVTATSFMTPAAQAGPPEPVKVVAEGLSGPFEVSSDYHGGLLVTEGFIGQVTRVNPHTGATTPVITDVPGASGAIRFGKFVAIVTGEADPAAPPPVPGSSVLLAKPGKTPYQFADLMANELKKNPDGQIQFDENGVPLDALSNPFNIARDRTGKGLFLVADGGGNAVLRVGRHGKVSTFFVPPVVRTGECAERPNNTVDGFGCDPVPTGLAYGPHGKLYVSTLGAEAPGAGRVYVLNPWNGKVLKVYRGLNSPTGVAVSPRGTIFVSNVLESQITRIGIHGSRTVAEVTMPVGLLWSRGGLYSSAFALADPGAGQVVKVSGSAFGPAA